MKLELDKQVPVPQPVIPPTPYSIPVVPLPIHPEPYSIPVVPLPIHPEQPWEGVYEAPLELPWNRGIPPYGPEQPQYGGPAPTVRRSQHAEAPIWSPQPLGTPYPNTGDAAPAPHGGMSSHYSEAPPLPFNGVAEGYPYQTYPGQQYAYQPPGVESQRYDTLRV